MATINEQIDSLIESAEKEKDENLSIMLLAIKGARLMEADGFLAMVIQEFMNATIIPAAQKFVDDTNSKMN